MLEEIKIQNFKLFEEQVEFKNLRALNLLTGINGRGKSSFLQSMLLMHQSVIRNENTKTLILTADSVKIGSTDDAKNSSSRITEEIVFQFRKRKEGIFTYRFLPKGKNDTSIPLFKFEAIIPVATFYHANSSDEWYNFVPVKCADKTTIGDTFRNMQYVAASRIEPQFLFKSESEPTDYLTPQATNLANVLYTHQEESVSKEYQDAIKSIFPSLRHNGIEDISVIGQVEYWMSAMFGATEVTVNYVNEVQAYTLQYKTLNKQGTFKPTNVGYGYTCILPIIVAGLVARKGGILIVENPEAHLHPQGQSVIAKFLACLAMSGVQVFVETHSEHILNGMRVLMSQGVLTLQDLSVKFFYESEKYYQEVELGEHGEIKDWPEDFFDQEERDLDLLLS